MPMKATSGISFDNAAVAATPKHLLQFAVDQRYDDYTPVDHAVWRFIMRQNIFFLKEYAHKVYFQGLLDTGISFERIPRIDEMNQILGTIDWGAVAVDGFIPPAAFMEFQAYKVLVIACDMRQIHHIEYTPAPDIVHEAAGHAPIIVDREYSNYLQRFGEVGAKAMSSKKDFELYQSIRRMYRSISRPSSRNSSSAAISNISPTCLRNLQARWRSWSAASKALTRRLNATTPQRANTRPASKSAACSTRSSRTKMILRS